MQVDFMTEFLRKKVVSLALLDLMRDPHLLLDEEIVNGCFVEAIINAIGLALVCDSHFASFSSIS
jgi:hypothetical protein